MLHKLTTFKDPDIDRQFREVIDAINNFTLIHKTTGKPYQLTVENDGVQTPVIILQEVQ